MGKLDESVFKWPKTAENQPSRVPVTDEFVSKVCGQPLWPSKISHFRHKKSLDKQGFNLNLVTLARFELALPP